MCDAAHKQAKHRQYCQSTGVVKLTAVLGSSNLQFEPLAKMNVRFLVVSLAVAVFGLTAHGREVVAARLGLTQPQSEDTLSGVDGRLQAPKDIWSDCGELLCILRVTPL